MRAIRVREHVNPLGKKYQELIAMPNWAAIYPLAQPLGLDIGCGKGEYVLEMAKTKPDWNWLGLEIREPLVERAIAIQKSLGLSNLHYIFCNVNVALANLLPPQSVHQVSIQFPDPWFKRRQHKRRTVQPELVKDIANILIPAADVLLQSDIEPVAQQMLQFFEQDEHFINLAGRGAFTNSYPPHIPTDREQWTIANGGAVYRCHLQFKPPH